MARAHGRVFIYYKEHAHGSTWRIRWWLLQELVGSPRQLFATAARDESEAREGESAPIGGWDGRRIYQSAVRRGWGKVNRAGFVGGRKSRFRVKKGIDFFRVCLMWSKFCFVRFSSRLFCRRSFQVATILRLSFQLFRCGDLAAGGAGPAGMGFFLFPIRWLVVLYTLFFWEILLVIGCLYFGGIYWYFTLWKRRFGIHP